MAYRNYGIQPFGGGGSIFGLRRELDRLFEDAMGGRASTWSPAVDVREDDKGIALEVELPGIAPDQVDVSVDNGVLTIRGEKRAERKEGEERQYHVVERSYGSFMRSFVLPQGIDESQISASFDHGVLTVSIPKAALPQPRKIQIGSTGQGASHTQQVHGSGSSSRETASRPRSKREESQSDNAMAAKNRENE